MDPIWDPGGNPAWAQFVENVASGYAAQT